MTPFLTALVLGIIIGIFCGYKQLPWYYAFCSTFIVSMILCYVLGGF